MELLFERAGVAVEVNGLPAALWIIRGGDGARLGIATVAEIVAIPPIDCMTVTQARALLALELETPTPRMRLQPTEKLVSAHCSPARLWIGSTDMGLTVGAFLCGITPEDEDFASLLAEQLIGGTVNFIQADVPDALAIDPAEALR